MPLATVIGHIGSRATTANLIRLAGQELDTLAQCTPFCCVLWGFISLSLQEINLLQLYPQNHCWRWTLSPLDYDSEYWMILNSRVVALHWQFARIVGTSRGCNQVSWFKNDHGGLDKTNWARVRQPNSIYVPLSCSLGVLTSSPLGTSPWQHQMEQRWQYLCILTVEMRYDYPLIFLYWFNPQTKCELERQVASCGCHVTLEVHVACLAVTRACWLMLECFHVMAMYSIIVQTINYALCQH